MLYSSPRSTFNFKKNYGGYTPGPPLKGGGEGRGEGEEREGAREGSPNLHSWLRHCAEICRASMSLSICLSITPSVCSSRPVGRRYRSIAARRTAARRAIECPLSALLAEQRLNVQCACNLITAATCLDDVSPKK